jgi:hypothetical protein
VLFVCFGVVFCCALTIGEFQVFNIIFNQIILFLISGKHKINDLRPDKDSRRLNVSLNVFDRLKRAFFLFVFIPGLRVFGFVLVLVLVFSYNWQICTIPGANL